MVFKAGGGRAGRVFQQPLEGVVDNPRTGPCKERVCRDRSPCLSLRSVATGMKIYDAGGHRGPPLRMNALLIVIPAKAGIHLFCLYFFLIASNQ